MTNAPATGEHIRVIGESGAVLEGIYKPPILDAMAIHPQGFFNTVLKARELSRSYHCVVSYRDPEDKNKLHHQQIFNIDREGCPTVHELGAKVLELLEETAERSKIPLE